MISKYNTNQIVAIIKALYPGVTVTSVEPMYWDQGSHADPQAGFSNQFKDGTTVIGCFYGDAHFHKAEFSASPSTGYLQLERYKTTDTTDGRTLIACPIVNNLPQNNSKTEDIWEVAFNYIEPAGAGYTLVGYKVLFELEE